MNKPMQKHLLNLVTWAMVFGLPVSSFALEISAGNTESQGRFNALRLNIEMLLDDLSGQVKHEETNRIAEDAALQAADAVLQGEITSAYDLYNAISQQYNNLNGCIKKLAGFTSCVDAIPPKVTRQDFTLAVGATAVDTGLNRSTYPFCSITGAQNMGYRDIKFVTSGLVYKVVGSQYSCWGAYIFGFCTAGGNVPVYGYVNSDTGDWWLNAEAQDQTGAVYGSCLKLTAN